ncbi:hypothetical protein [Almyronema epifaneia]|uniref:Uncharacterized protein n=1 Tax=Almyronema epifaneia S1 TaxID=2991925 RepID=A0ABW6IC24_9CYAN
MQDPLQDHRQHAAKEFRQALAALEAFLNTTVEEQQTLTQPSNSAQAKTPNHPIDLAALEEAAADIERYMKSRNGEPPEQS